MYIQRATALLVAAVATCCNSQVSSASRYCNAFQLTLMPRVNHARSTYVDRLSQQLMAAQREGNKLLQRSQLRQHGEFWHASVSERQRSQPCGQNLRVPFLRTVLPPEVEECACWSNGGHGKTKELISPPPR